MTPVVIWDVIRGIILPSAVLPRPMGPRNLPFAFAYALCPAGMYALWVLIPHNLAYHQCVLTHTKRKRSKLFNFPTFFVNIRKTSSDSL